MPALKVLQIHNRYREAGGEDTVAARETSLLRAAGHTVVEYHVGNPTEPRGAASTLLVAPWNPRAAARLRNQIEEVRPDIAHVHNTWWTLTPSILRELDRLGVPTVATLHNYRLMCVNAQLFRNGAPCEDCVGSHPWHGVQHRCYRGSVPASTVSAATIQLNRWLRTWQRVDRILVLTDFARSRFVASGIPADHLHLKPNFVDDPGRRFGSPSSSQTVLFVGRLSEEKGIADLLDVWATTVPVDLKLAVVGDGPLRSSLESLNIPNVHFVGQLAGPEVQQLMLSSRALVFPSIWYEGQPMVLLEALAAGLPLVVSDIGGLPEIVAGTTAAVLARPGDSGSWSDALGHLADNLRIDQSGKSARRVFEERYSPEIGLDRLMHEYEGAIAHRKRRAL
jgi:glycosyltransferase involved in cell wall biosynthesis